MRKIFVILFMLIVSATQAATYYVSATGSDSNDGLSTGAPWQTLTKASTWLAEGSNILFKRGDTFYGTLNMFNSGAAGNIKTFGAYGTGANPIITGFTTISGWTNEGSGVYSKIITSDAKTTMVTVDGVQVAMGRYPNTGYRSYEGISTNVSITDTGLGTLINWTGAEAVIRKNDWTLDRCTITNHTGDVLTYTSLGSSLNGTVGYGYFIQNDLRTLDQLGEWFHNTGTGKFYMYFGAVDPTTKTVKVATKTNLISARSYTNLSNIDFIGCIGAAIDGTEGLTTTSTTDCNFSFAGGFAISQRGTASTIERNAITNSTQAILSNRPNAIIKDNVIQNIGLVDGVSTAGANNAIEVAQIDNLLIQGNSIVNIGYNAIKIGSYAPVGTTTVKNNYINNACASLNDGGAIYTGGTQANLVIDGNIILNTIGNIAGTTHGYMAEGIYLDEFAQNVTVQNNTVANCSTSGIKLHKSSNCSVLNNTLYNNIYGVQYLNSAGTSTITGQTLTGNKIIAKAADQLAMILICYSINDCINFGITANNNYYARPIDDNLTIKIAEPANWENLKSLATWQIYKGQDANSFKSPKAITSVDDLLFYYNETGVPKQVNLSVPCIDVTGKGYTGTITISPYSSVVLLRSYRLTHLGKTLRF